MAPKSLVLPALLVLVSAAARAAVGANVAPTVLISGIVRCNFGSSISTNNAAVPDASVKLVCGGNAVASVTADGDATFIIKLQPSLLSANNGEVLTALVTDKCKVVASTSLAVCSASTSLPGGVAGTTLTAPLQLLGASTGGLVTLIGSVAVTTVGDVLSFLAI